MFDFTNQITLNIKYQKIYRRLQVALYFLAFSAGLYLVYSILFPKAYFTFSFSSPNSLQNTVINPEINNNLPDHGIVPQNENLVFFTALTGNYSKVKISFSLNKNSEITDSGKVNLQKSYQAFFYPEGNSEDLPDSEQAVFKINNDYYLLKDNQWHKFISEKAYLTNFTSDHAIVKNSDFLKNHEVSDRLLGFSDGTLISYGVSAYIVSQGKILPINNVTTFSAMGYNWADVIPASGDEISLYEKDKLFTLSSSHPTGTVFKTEKNNRYYLVKDQKKYSLPPEKAVGYLLGKSPVLVSEESLSLIQNCHFSKNFLSSRTFSCEIPLDSFVNLIGKDYRLNLSAEDREIKIDTLNVSFEKTLSFSNLKSSLANIITRVKNNYASSPTQ